MTACKECGGKGSYEIRNAYNPEFKQIIKCEYCKGSCVDNTSIRYPKTKTS